jgi:branched-chain amino acid transport system ATP-binding protein
MTDGQTHARNRLDDPLLRLDGVTSGYGATTVLQDVNVDIGTGEVVGIVGRNGVGKTTTLRTIMGELEPDAGTITYGGRDITTLEPEETVQNGVALVPEERRIFHDLSIRENLELAKMGGVETDSGRSVDEVLEMFENLAGNGHMAGSALSGGEQQMLAIGRALVSNAQFLMLDEPTEGLAPYIVQRVMEIIEDLSEQALTILLVEQNVHMALDVCDYVYVLDNGRIVHEDTAANLREDDAILDRYLGVTV